MDSFDQAPIATIVEQKLMRWFCARAGLPASCDGTFTTGGSQSNYMGLLLARDAFLQKHWNWSAQKSRTCHPEARRLRILCSEVAHFTVEKSASQLGLGTDAVVRVAVDDRFRMRSCRSCEFARALRKLRICCPWQSWRRPARPTSDPSIHSRNIAAIAARDRSMASCRCSLRRALLFSPRHRDKLAGIEAADSLCIDFHKLFWQPIPCSAFLLPTRDTSSFIKMHADYSTRNATKKKAFPIWSQIPCSPAAASTP